MPFFNLRIPTRRSKLDLRKVQSTGNIDDPIILRRPLNVEPNIETTKEEDSQSASSSLSEGKPEQDLADRLKSISANNLELLLSMETQARIDHIEEQQERQQRTNYSGISTTPSNDNGAPRPSRLKFELPATPVRSKSPPSALVPTKRWSYGEEPLRTELKPIKDDKKRSKWRRIRLGSHDSAMATIARHRPDPSFLQIGSRVRLIRRPVLTMGYVRFMGFVDFAPGEWIGVELDSGVGKNDGSVDGSRYFQTDPNRGVFVTREELIGV